MFIRVATAGERYAFVVGEDPKSPLAACFCSNRDHYLVRGLPRDYRTFAEAHVYAQRLIDHFPSLIAAKHLLQKTADDPQADFVSHYGKVVDSLTLRLQTILDLDRDVEPRLQQFVDELDAVKNEITSAQSLVDPGDNAKILNDILEDLDKLKAEAEAKLPLETPEAPTPPLLDATGQPVPVAQPAQPPLPFSVPQSSLPSVEASAKTTDATLDGNAILRAFSEAATMALVPQHPTAYLRLITHDPALEVSTAAIADGNQDVCLLKFDEHLMLCGVLPGPAAPAYHTAEFFDHYWEPVVDAVGHIKDGDRVVVAHVSPMTRCSQWGGFVDETAAQFAVDFPTERRTWILKIAAQQEVQVTNEMVRCTDRNLPSLFGRTGTKLAEEPHADYIELLVDFGRGLGTVKLTNAQVEILELSPI